MNANVKVLTKCRYHKTIHKCIFIRQDGKEIKLTIERLNGMYIISREVKCVGVHISIDGEHYGIWITGMV